MALGYLVEATAQKSNYTGSTFGTFVSNALSAVVIGETVILYVSQDGPVPASVSLSNGDTLTLLHANPNGYCSIWGGVITTAGSTVTATATWSVAENYISVLLVRYQNLPAAINVIDVGDATIASGTNNEIGGLTNVGSGIFDFIVLVCGQTAANQTDTEIHEQFALHEYRRLGGDEFAHMYDHVGISELTAITLEADYPNSSSPKRLCVVMIEAGSTAAIPAVLAQGRGAIWMGTGHAEADSQKYVLYPATGGILTSELVNVNRQGGAMWFPYDAYIDRLHVLVDENTAATGGTFAFAHESGGRLNSIVPMPTGEVGWLTTDGGDLDFVPAGSFIRGVMSADGVSIRVAGLSYRVTPLDGLSTITKFMAYGQTDFNSSTNPYIGILGQVVGFASAQRTIPDYRVGEACTAAYVCIYVHGNACTSDTTIIVQKNDADTALLVTVPAGATGYFTSGVLMVAVAANDVIRYRIAYGAGTIDFSIRSIQIDLISTAHKFFGGLGNQGRTESPNQFPMAGINTAFAGGYTTDTKMVAAFTFTKLDIKILTNTGGGTLQLYQNGTATAIVVTIADGELGWVDVLGALRVSPDDTIFDLLWLILTALGATLEYSVISWAATLVDVSVSTSGVIGPLVIVRAPRRLPDGTIEYDNISDHDMQDPLAWYGGFKDGVITSLGVAERPASHIWTGDWQGSTFDYERSDVRLTQRQNFASVLRRYYVGAQQVLMTTRANRAALGQAFTVFAGPMIDAQPVPPLKWRIQLGDAVSQGILNDQHQIPFRMVGDGICGHLTKIADDLDLTTPEPIIYGQHRRIQDLDPASPQGFQFTPIYLGIITIDAVDYHVWLVAGHACADIPDALVDGASILADEGVSGQWRIPHHTGFDTLFGAPYVDYRSATYGDDLRNTIILGLVSDPAFLDPDVEYGDLDLMSDPDAVALGNRTLTIFVDGVDTIGDGSGEVITDRLLQYQHFAVHYMARAGQRSYRSGLYADHPNPTWTLFDALVPIVDEASFQTCSDIAFERFPTGTGSPVTVGGYVGAAIIGARPGTRASVRQWIAQWNRSCLTRLGVTHEGQLRVWMFHPTQAEKDAAPLYTDQYEILDGSFGTDISWRDHANVIPFVADYDHVSGQWKTADVYREPESITNYGRDIPSEIREYPFAPGITMATHLAILEGRIRKEPPRIIRLSATVGPNPVDGSSLGYLDGGDYIRVQHFDAVTGAPADIRLAQVITPRVMVGERKVGVDVIDCEDLIGFDAPDVAPEEGVSPVNETCAAAIDIGGSPSTPYTVTIDTTNHGTDLSISNAIVADQAYHAAWWSITPVEDGRLFVTTVHSDYDTQLAILTGTCGSSPADWAVEAYNDNDGLLATSVLDIPCIGGQEYFILVAGYGPNDGGRLTLGVQAYVP